MKAILAVLALVSFSLAFNGRVAAQMSHECQHDMTTVASLYHCVQHAAEMGHIDNAGVAQSLLAKIDAAQAAVDRGQQAVAVNQLEALIRELDAQSGRHVGAEHAIHLAEHTLKIIQVLGG